MFLVENKAKGGLNLFKTTREVASFLLGKAHADFCVRITGEQIPMEDGNMSKYEKVLSAAMSERYFVGSDESSHKYLVPLSKQAEWEAWRELPEDNPDAWDAPEWAERLGGGRLTFTDPQTN